MLLDAYQFWLRHFGSRLTPIGDGSDPLMRSYPNASPDKRETRFGNPGVIGAFLITPDRAVVRSGVSPSVMPGDVDAGPACMGVSFKRWVRDIILDPPAAPFLFATIGPARADVDNWAVTLDPEAIRLGGNPGSFGGSGSLIASRTALMRGFEWVADGGCIKDLRTRNQTIARMRAGLISADFAKKVVTGLKTPLEVIHRWEGPQDDFLIDLITLPEEAARHEGSTETEKEPAL